MEQVEIIKKYLRIKGLLLTSIFAYDISCPCVTYYKNDHGGKSVAFK